MENRGFCRRIAGSGKDVTELLKKFSLCLTQPYMGHTGYSTKENVNNIEIVHLHWGLQLIFDASQKEGNNEIWIDVYPLTRFLAEAYPGGCQSGGDEGVEEEQLYCGSGRGRV